MRTSIFSQFANLRKDFSEDFSTLWELPDKHRLALIGYVSQIAKTTTTDDKKKLMEAAALDIGGDIPNLLRSMQVLTFVSSQWDPMHDTPENFLKDLEELELIPEEKSDEARKFLQGFFHEIQRDNLRRLQKMYANSLMPSLEGISTLVDFRAVFDKLYHLGDDLDSYHPKCVDLTPVVLIKIVRDSGVPQTIVFQCEPESVKLMIGQLQSALRCLDAARHERIGGER